MSRLLVLSGKGGTGKTTVSASFIKLAKSQAVADCDVDAPNLHLVFDNMGIPETFEFMGGDKAFVNSTKCIGCGVCTEHCKFDAISLKNSKAVVNEFSCEGCGVCNYVCPVKAVELKADIAGKRELYTANGIFSTAILKMGRGNSGKLVSEVKRAITKSATSELAIIDGAPGIGCPVIASISGVDMVLIVAEPSQSGISDLVRLVHTIQTFGAKIAVCVNKYDVSLDCTEAIMDFCKECKIAFVGIIPYDKQAVWAVNAGLTIVDIDCPAGRAVENIYNKITKLI